MTTLDILNEARDILLENTEDIVTTDQLLAYANRAKDDISKRLMTNDFITTGTLSFTNGQATLPIDFDSIYWASDQNTQGTGNNFRWFSSEDFQTGNFDYGITKDAGVLKVVPSTTGTLYVRYWKTIADMTLSGSPTLPTYTHELLVPGILWRAYRKLQDFELSRVFKEEYETELATKNKAISISEEGSQKGGTIFKYQN